MFEWILVGMICATAIVMVAHTIDEALRCARPLRPQLRHCPGSPVPEEERASSSHRDDHDRAQKQAA